MPGPLIIAIDGQSSCGKSTLASDIARKLQIAYIDSGAMYRALTYAILEKGLSPENKSGIKDLLKEIKLNFIPDGHVQHIALNGMDIEKEIRTPRITEHVSEISTIPEVRHFLVDQQRQYGASNSLVMDGRDIGTVVFPNASIKLFLTAELEIRVDRRFDELIQRGQAVSREEVKDNLSKRDQIDSTREMSPLRMASDAYLIDNSHISRDGQLELALNFIQLAQS